MNILQRYRPAGLGFGTRLFLDARFRLTPYSKMASQLPNEGRILDLGCGHGLLSLTLALAEPKRDVIGIDHDSERVRLAQVAAEGVSNLHFERGSLLAPPPGPWHGIAAIDVFHYFEPRVQNTILGHLRETLGPDGVFIMREVDPEGGVAAVWNRAYETIATRTGFTQTKQAGLHFRTPSEWSRQLEKSGFNVSAERCSSPLFADILYVCRPR
ncbi:MAG: class I SAM-dependent methyltransferase [Oligoflexia bacterium]|nr:class I SAM-dependent methyltransferase [Oligoflexia bacterium]